ncbi:MAG: hypothetical protein V3U79_04485 [Dehalococcoidia bacterium]
MIVPLGAMGIFQVVREEFFSERTQETYRLSNIKLPEWAWQTWIVLALVVSIVFILEGAYREVSRREAASPSDAALNQSAIRMALKNLLGKRRTAIYEVSAGEDEQIKRELQSTLDLIEAAFGEGEATPFAQGSYHPIFRRRGTPDWQFRVQGALRDLDDLISRSDTMTLVSGFDPEEWERQFMPAQEPDTSEPPPGGAE